MYIKDFIQNKVARKILIGVALTSILVANLLGAFLFDLRHYVIEKRYGTLQALFRFSFKNSLLYFIISGLFLLVTFRLFYIFRSSFGDLRKGQKGTSRFSTDDEIRHAYKAIPYLPSYDEMGQVIRYEGKSGFLTSRIGSEAYIDTSDSHTISIGRTRGGKDETKVLPDLEQISRSEELPHIVCTTVKYETIEKTKEELEERGYIVEVLNLVDLDKSFGYNPLDLIKDAYMRGEIDEADELCKTFSHPLYYDPHAKEKIWQEAAMGMVNSCILALCHEFIHPSLEVKHPELVTLGAIVNMMIQLSGSYQLDKESRFKLDEYFNSLSLDNPARQEYSMISVTAGQMRSSILGSTLGRLQKFVSPKVKRMMNRTTFDFSKLTDTKQPYCIMVILPDYTQTNYIIATTFIEQCYYYLSRHATLHQDRLPKRVRFILNEFGNMPPFSSLQSMVSVGAGRGMLFDFYLQDFTQFTIKYGKDTANFITSQVMTTVYIVSSDYETHKKFSDMLGYIEYIETSRSGHWLSLNKTVSERVEKRPLLLPEQIGRILEGEWIVVRTKRLNDRYEDTVPYPIYNHGDSRMLKAHRYLDEIFIRKNFDDLALKYHGNNDWTEEQNTTFIKAIETRIKEHGSPEVQAAIEESEEKQQEQEKEKEMETLKKQMNIYGNVTQKQIKYELTGQQQPESLLEANPLYLKIKELVHTEYPELMEAFYKIDTKSKLNRFIEAYSNQFSYLKEEEKE